MAHFKNVTPNDIEELNSRLQEVQYKNGIKLVEKNTVNVHEELPSGERISLLEIMGGGQPYPLVKEPIMIDNVVLTILPNNTRNLVLEIDKDQNVEVGAGSDSTPEEIMTETKIINELRKTINHWFYHLTPVE